MHKFKDEYPVESVPRSDWPDHRAGVEWQWYTNVPTANSRVRLHEYIDRFGEENVKILESAHDMMGRSMPNYSAIFVRKSAE